jgi:adenylate cyclase
MKQRQTIFTPTTGWQHRLPAIVSRLLNAGTADYPPSARSGLIAANATGYLAALSSLNYAAFYAIQDLGNLAALVIGNILSAVLTACVPFVHRFGRIAGGLLLTVTIFTTIFYFTAVLGRESGILLNYLGASALAFLVLGVNRLPLVATIIVSAAVLHLCAWFWFPPGNTGLDMPPAFLAQTYAFSAISIMTIISLVIFYVFSLLRREQHKTDELLLNIMPETIAEQLKADPGRTIADRHDHATVMFADLTGFTPLAAELSPDEVVEMLDELFSAFDREVSRTGVEKIKTIGDAYMAVAGAPRARPDHAAAIAELALAMLGATHATALRSGRNLRLRIGIATGPVMAGVIGRTKFAYDIWGETVNRAARLEANGTPGVILVDEATAVQLRDRFKLRDNATLDLKGIGPTATWQLRDRLLH